MTPIEPDELWAHTTWGPGSLVHMVAEAASGTRIDRNGEAVGFVAVRAKCGTRLARAGLFYEPPDYDNLCAQCIDMTLDETPEWFVYQVNDLSGQCLYIGSTGHLVQRLATHRQSSPWFLPGQIQLSHLRFGDAATAQAFEKFLIATIRPLYNVRGNHPLAESKRRKQLQVIEAALAA